MIEMVGDYTSTNADKIRQMPDDELAKFLAEQFCHGVGEKLILEWLQKPAKEDNE